MLEDDYCCTVCVMLLVYISESAVLHCYPRCLSHSTYVASKLNVWTTAGLHKMEEFLAKMGLSLAQCKQKYQFMNSSVSVCVRVHSAYTAAASSSLTLVSIYATVLTVSTHWRSSSMV
jgi:CDC45-like protein